MILWYMDVMKHLILSIFSKLFLSEDNKNYMLCLGNVTYAYSKLFFYGYVIAKEGICINQPKV